jgi:hypothetical protein
VKCMEMLTQGTKWSANYVQITTKIRDFIYETRNLVAYMLNPAVRALSYLGIPTHTAAVGLRSISDKVQVNEGIFFWKKIWTDQMEQCFRFRSYTLLTTKF